MIQRSLASFVGLLLVAFVAFAQTPNAPAQLTIRGGSAGWPVGEGGSEPPPVPSANPCDGITPQYHVIPSGGVGAQNGTNWSNAYNALPSSLDRGGCYWIADGSVGNYIFDDATNGTELITVAKATEDYHGSATGWNSALGNGQADFGYMAIDTNYYAVKGAVRDEACPAVNTSDCGWLDLGSYGFTASQIDSGSEFITGGPCAQNITIEHVGISQGTYGEVDAGHPVYLVFTNCDNWTVRRSLFTDSGDLQLNGVDDLLWEYNAHYLLNGKECIRSQASDALNVTMRFNVFYNCCDDSNNPGGGCTEEVGFFGNPTQNFDGFKFYGNIIRKTINQHKTDSSVLVQADDCEMYNNTVVDDSDSGQGGLVCSGTGGTVRNNVAYFPNGMTNNISATTANNNTTYTSSPAFTSTSTGNFHLTGALAGAAIGAPFDDEDFDGCPRTTPDRGAYEQPSC